MNVIFNQSLDQDNVILVLLQLKSIHYEDGYMDIHVHVVHKKVPILIKLHLDFDPSHLLRNRIFAAVKEHLLNLEIEGISAGISLQWENMPTYKEDVLSFFADLMREINLNKERKASRFVMSKELRFVKENELDSLPLDENRLALELVLAKGSVDKEAWSPVLHRLEPLAEVFPDHFDLILLKGQCMFALRKKDEARAFLKSASENKNADPGRLMEVAFWLYKRNEKDLAIELLEKPLQDPENIIFSRYLLAQIYYGFRDSRYSDMLKIMKNENPLLFVNYIDQAWDYKLKIRDLTPISLDVASEIVKGIEGPVLETMAYKGKVPADYNVDADELTFFKEEIEAWHDFRIKFLT